VEQGLGKGDRPRVAVFVGTRPEIIKMRSIIRTLQSDRRLDLLCVHTGQHYDWSISGRFFRELSLPTPNSFLNVGSGSHGRQTAEIIRKSERALVQSKPAIVLVEGDTNSSLGVTIAASKLNIPVGHVEAGCRSFDMTMPEEINRKMISDCASLNFAPTTYCVRNLMRERIVPATIFLTGHPIVDLVLAMRPLVRTSGVLHRLRLQPRMYALLTIHRQENTDDPQRLEGILRGLSSLPLKVVFPVHPRTGQRLRRYDLSDLIKNFIAVSPLGYADTLRLIKEARIVLTDSGGIQQEAYLFKTPCITLRDSTEWMETVRAGMNFLAGSDSSRILRTVNRVLRLAPELKHPRAFPNLFGKGNAAGTIVRILKAFTGV
jgi:UDP-N-acetylglucosamine 2-epimerase